MTDRVAKDRLGEDEGIDVVVGALDTQFEFMGSHRTTAIERGGVKLERERRCIHRYFAVAQAASAAPLGCASTKRAKTTIRFSAL